MSSQREFKAVFFDLDGTLVDIHGPLYTAARSALDDLGHAPPLTREHYHQALEQDDPFLGLPEDKRADYTKLAFAYFLAEIDRTERLELLPHVQETLAELKRRGYATALITSRPGDSQRLVEIGPTDALFARPGHPYTRQLLGTIEAGAKEYIAKEPAPPADATGCRYRSRCAFADDTCARSAPPLVISSEGRRIACHHYADF